MPKMAHLAWLPSKPRWWLSRIHTHPDPRSTAWKGSLYLYCVFARLDFRRVTETLSVQPTDPVKWHQYLLPSHMGFSSWLLWPYPPFLIPSISSAPQVLPYNLVLLTYKCTFLFMFSYPLKLSRCGSAHLAGEEIGRRRRADLGMIIMPSLVRHLILHKACQLMFILFLSIST